MIKSIKNWLRGLALSGLITIGSAIGGKADAVDIGGFFIDAPNCSTKVYRKPTGSIDTLKTITNSDGLWVKLTEQFEPDAIIGDTLYIEGGWNLGKHAKTMWIRGPPGENNVYDMHPDKFTVNLEDVIDTSNLTATLKAIYSLDGIAPCTTEIDTGYDQGWTFHYDIHAPFNKSDATHGKSGNIDLVKTLGDTIWKTQIPFTIDTTAFDAQALPTPVYFPQEKIIKDTTPPTIENATEWSDTNYKGPFPVDADISDASGIGSAWLKYKLNNDSVDSTEADSMIGSKYYFTINKTASDKDSVHYNIKAKDASANENEASWPGLTPWHSFYVNSVGAEEPKVKDNLEFKVWPTVVKNKFYVKGADKFSVSDVTGRIVKNYEVNINGAYEFDMPSGVYFVKNGNKTKKVIKLK